MTDAPKIDAAAGNPLLQTWDTPFGRRPSIASGPSISGRPSTRRWRGTGPRSRPSRLIPPRRPSPTPSMRWSVRASCSSGWAACSGTWPARTPTPRLQAVEREMSPRLAKHYSDIAMNEALFARIDALRGQRRRRSA